MTKDTAEQELAFKSFVKEFGTHYMRETDFGASIYFEMRFFDRSKNESQLNTREDCVEKGAKNCAGLSGSFKGVSANIETCKEDRTEKCSVRFGGNMYLIYNAIKV